MTLVNAETGEVVSELTPDEARDLTERIRDGLTLTWQLVVEAHDRRAWKALGYASFRSWVEGELNISRGHAYRMLDHGRVMQALAEHAGVSPMGDIPERLTRGLDADEAVGAAMGAVGRLPETATDDEKADAVINAMDGLRKAMTERQRQERETTTAPTTAGEEGPGTASRPEPSEPAPEPVDVERHADPRLTVRANFSRDIAKAGVLRMVDIDKAVASADPDDLAGFRQSVQSIRDWCDRFLEASNTTHLRRVK